jgi:hypothetical protein
MEDNYLNEIEEIINRKRKTNPLQQEYDKLFNAFYPMEEFYNVFKLGFVQALSIMKNDVSKYMCKDCNECLDIIIKSNRNDKVLDDYFNKLLK